MTVARGGRPLYGAHLGILMLEARFPRIPGDMGNAATWPFPVLYRVVRGASPDRVVRQHAKGLLPDFIEAARELVALGAAGITTNCGFLSLFQAELQEAVPVPVAASSLMQAPLIRASLGPSRRVGIVTVSAASLSRRHLDSAGVAPGTPVEGIAEDSHFSRVILGDELELDTARAEKDVIAAATGLIAHHADVGAILLECTNMAPYAAAVRVHTGLPVFDIVSLITWFHAGLRPMRFPPPEG